SLIFFFRADDGIRDFHVTGVQTCALPNYRNIRHRIEPQPDADAMKEATEHEKLRIIAADAPRPVLYHHRQNEKGAHEIADESGFGCRESAAEIANDAVHRHEKKCRQYHPHDPLQGCTVLQTTRNTHLRACSCHYAVAAKGSDLNRR